MPSYFGYFGIVCITQHIGYRRQKGLIIEQQLYKCLTAQSSVGAAPTAKQRNIYLATTQLKYFRAVVKQLCAFQLCFLEFLLNYQK